MPLTRSASKTMPALDGVKVQSIPFLDFPPEIRNSIYLLAFEVEEPLLMVDAPGQNKLRAMKDLASLDWPCTNSGVSVALPVSLLRSSWAVHDEAAPVLYGTNTFVIVERTNVVEESLRRGTGMKEFVATIQSELMYVRSIRIRTPILTHGFGTFGRCFGRCLGPLHATIKNLPTVSLTKIELNCQGILGIGVRSSADNFILPLLKQIRKKLPEATEEKLVNIVCFVDNEPHCRQVAQDFTITLQDIVRKKLK